MSVSRAQAAAVALEWVKPPLQARSQKTLERLLDAAEAIIDEKGLDNATVAEIAKRAGSSVGSFYARFADKEALIRCVFERFNDQAIATATAVLTPDRWDEMETHEALETMALFMLRIVRERRQLLAAMMMRSASDPDLSAFGQRLHAVISAHMLGLIAHRGHVVDHRDPELGVRMAVWLVLSAIESRVLSAAAGSAPQLTDEVVAGEMATMVIRYLGVDREMLVAEYADARQAQSKITRHERGDSGRVALVREV